MMTPPDVHASRKTAARDACPRRRGDRHFSCRRGAVPVLRQRGARLCEVAITLLVVDQPVAGPAGGNPTRIPPRRDRMVAVLARTAEGRWGVALQIGPALAALLAGL